MPGVAAGPKSSGGQKILNVDFTHECCSPPLPGRDVQILMSSENQLRDCSHNSESLAFKVKKS